MPELTTIHYIGIAIIILLNGVALGLCIVALKESE